ncbi:prolactin-7D1-like isoform X2 [Alexandromys fortis]|uniref:prolactin-7D1-like isoform X2 n=1 Tax=Alexandromys fortis TaxID=100897 RepID=UPI002151FEBE|nr:prolactin-7D1-like isoform X2 [Microtus fortis]
MPLTLTQPCSWTFLMLLLSNLLLWEGVASTPMNISDAGLSEVSLKDLVKNALILAENISDLATDMRREFFFNKYSSRIFNQIMLNLQWDVNKGKILKHCHILPIESPSTIEEFRKKLFEDILNTTLLILRDWKDPLKYLVKQLHSMPGVPDVILSMAEAIEDQHKIFLEHMMKIVPKVNPAIQENEATRVWLDVRALQITDKRTQFLALYMFSLCLQLDLRVVEYYVHLLKCLHVDGDICFYPTRSTPS